ncbi:MAG: CsbD family protein, partial [Thermoleophilia bacterium]|nr:CsbD family protein [Thermoleophilia bacterium]
AGWLQPTEGTSMGEQLDKAKGRTKEAAGALSGDGDLKREGQVDQAKGGIKGAVDDAGDAVKDALDGDHKD